MNGIIEALYRFFETLGMPAALLPLLPFLTCILLLYVVLFAVTGFLVKKKVMHAKTASFYLFVSVWVVGFLLFTLGPMIFSFYISFTHWEVVSDPEWAGLDNYRRLFTDSMFYKSLSVTFYYTLVSVPLQVVLSLLIALLMNLKLRGIYLFRTIYYLPTLVQGVAQMVLFIWIFNPNVGLINSVLRLVGIEGPAWLSSPAWSMPAIIIMSLWTVGGNMIIYLAGLTDIPQSLYEQAEIDGASALRKMWSVTLPQISPILFFNAVTSMIGAFQTFYPRVSGRRRSRQFLAVLRLLFVPKRLHVVQNGLRLRVGLGAVRDHPDFHGLGIPQQRAVGVLRKRSWREESPCPQTEG